MAAIGWRLASFTSGPARGRALVLALACCAPLACGSSRPPAGGTGSGGLAGTGGARASGGAGPASGTGGSDGRGSGGSAGSAGVQAATGGAAGGGGPAGRGGGAGVAGATGGAGTRGATGGGAGGAPDAGTDSRGGAAGDPFLGDVTPARNGDLWRFTFGDVVFEVNAAQGASVTTFARAGHNVLADGSRFRPSPQKTWNWPPPPEIAQDAYTASQAGPVLTMESQTSAQWGVQAKKRFWANSTNDVVTIEYTLTNTSAAPASWGPWEVSRVNPTGLTFFPEGSAIAAKPASYGGLLALQSMGGVAWLDYNPALYTAGNYIVARDGLEGWSAHAETDVVFIKSFADIPPAQIPPEEGEIQLWTDNTHAVLEMENEGAYVLLAAKQSLIWTVRWYLRSIPADAPVTVGSTKLVDFVRAQLLK